MGEQRLLMLNGSPRKKGTSFSFARSLGMIAGGYGVKTEIRHVIDYFDGRESIDELIRLISECDIIGLTAPLYVDALPYIDIWLLEKLAAEYGGILKGKGFFAVGQCGFPDITRIEPIIDSGRLFARETGMKWFGGLAYGGGAMIDGKAIEEFGRNGKKILAGFDIAVCSIVNGEEIPVKAQEIMDIRLPKLVMPLVALYLNRRTKRLARESGNVDYAAKPYLE